MNEAMQVIQQNPELQATLMHLILSDRPPLDIKYRAVMAVKAADPSMDDVPLDDIWSGIASLYDTSHSLDAGSGAEFAALQASAEGLSKAIEELGIEEVLRRIKRGDE